MRRIRIVFLLLAVVLCICLALVVEKALDSTASERAIRHRLVADRIVDEMERELSSWLQVEEDRPFAHYRYFYVPEDSAWQLVNLSRSPLSRPPQEPFLVCYFQIDPDGAISSPLWPDNEELAGAIGWQPSQEARDVADLVVEAVSDFWRPLASEEDGSGGGPALAQSAATARADPSEVPEPPPEKAAVRRKESKTAALLSRLNRGARSRQERPTKVESSQAANVYNFLQKEANVLQEAVRTQAESADDEASGGVQTTLAPPPELQSDVARAVEAGKYGALIDVRMGPMKGRLATADHLVLYRKVSIAQQDYIQGMILDVATLVGWASDRVLADGDLESRAWLRLAGAGTERGDAYRYTLAAPFAAVATEVALDPLPERLGPVNLYSLSVLLAFASTFGLFALYRMVAVVVAYAERRNNFVSAVTHELKTPLTALRMYGEMLRDGVVPEESKRQRYYEIMTSETERLSRLIQNVLELSQLEQQKRSMQLVAGDVVPVVEEVVSVLRPHAEKHGFTLRVDAEAGLPQVRFDRDALLQVLFNVVDNALKYARGAERKEILLSCRRQGQGMALTVDDHGPGVPRQHLQKIFEPFYRAEDELTRTSQGTGIGLALVRGLVERMQGRVTGRNPKGGGFQIEIQLPGVA